MRILTTVVFERYLENITTFHKFGTRKGFSKLQFGKFILKINL